MDQEQSQNKLYVGGINYDSTEQGLAEYFAAAGTVVSAKIITDRMTGRSKGFGFVEMSSAEEMQKAIEMFDGKEFDGRTLRVNEARPQKPNFNRGGGYGNGQGRNEW